jgi:hypothetical protein
MISCIGRLLECWLDLVEHASVPAWPGPQMTVVQISVLADVLGVGWCRVLSNLTS